MERTWTGEYNRGEQFLGTIELVGGGPPCDMYASRPNEAGERTYTWRWGNLDYQQDSSDHYKGKMAAVIGAIVR